MHFQTLILITSILSQSVYAGYNIHLYTDAACGTLGHTCTNQKAKACCSYPGTAYHGARFDEPGSEACEDESAKQTTGDATNIIAGATVYRVGLAKRREHEMERRGQEAKTSVVPDQFFYENGKTGTRHVVQRDTPEGAAFLLIKRDEDKIKHLVKFGKREEVLVARGSACKNKKGGKKAAAAPAGKGAKADAKPAAKPAGKPAGKGH